MARRGILAYLAGFFDGEGCISINRNLVLRLSVRNINQEVLKLCENQFGGYTHKTTLHPKRTQSYSWTISGVGACYALIRIFPWLIIKKEEAKVAISLKSIINKNKMGRGKLPLNEVKIRREARLKIFEIRSKNSPNRKFSLRKTDKRS